MSRWSFFILGGDANSPAVRRLVWRISATSFVAGLGLGHFRVFDQKPEPDLGYALAAGVALCLSIITHEIHHYYRSADEMLKRILVESLAAAGAVLITSAILVGFLETLVGFPRPPMIAVALLACVVASVSWMAAAWRTT